jgi:hypothetical protein
MSSPNPYPEDEFDHLVRGALEAQVSGKEPPNRVWKQIKAELETEGSPPSRQSRVSWSALAIQATLTLVLVVIGGIGLRTVLDPDYVHYSSRDVSLSQTMAYVEEQSGSPGVPMFDDEAELRSLKAGLRPRPESQADAEPNDRPSVIASPDVPPNMLRLGKRAFESESSLPLIVEEQNPLHSGPYPW